MWGRDWLNILHLFFRLSVCAKCFTWKRLDFHENVWTGDIHLVLCKDSCQRGKSQLGIDLFIHELAQGVWFKLMPHKMTCWSILIHMFLNLLGFVCFAINTLHVWCTTNRVILYNYLSFRINSNYTTTKLHFKTSL